MSSAETTTRADRAKAETPEVRRERRKAGHRERQRRYAERKAARQGRTPKARPAARISSGGSEGRLLGVTGGAISAEPACVSLGGGSSERSRSESQGIEAGRELQPAPITVQWLGQRTSGTRGLSLWSDSPYDRQDVDACAEMLCEEGIYPTRKSALAAIYETPPFGTLTASRRNPDELPEQPPRSNATPR
jgi:hypothetical protein